jgi:hypothetical protein
LPSPDMTVPVADLPFTGRDLTGSSRSITAYYTGQSNGGFLRSGGLRCLAFGSCLLQRWSNLRSVSPRLLLLADLDISQSARMRIWLFDGIRVSAPQAYRRRFLPDGGSVGNFSRTRSIRRFRFSNARRTARATCSSKSPTCAFLVSDSTGTPRSRSHSNTSASRQATAREPIGWFSGKSPRLTMA